MTRALGAAAATSPDPHRLGGMSGERAVLLRRYQVLDTPPEPSFDDLCALAAQLCGTPVALVNLVERYRVFSKAAVGVAPREWPAEGSFCRETVASAGLLVVTDALADPRFASSPFVRGDGGFRFYAGAPLMTPEGVAIGTLCVVDTAPRPNGLTDTQADGLVRLARQVMHQLEHRRLLTATVQRVAELERLQDIVGIGGLEVDLRFGFANRRSPQYLRIHGLPPESTNETHAAWVARIHPDDRERVEREFVEAVAGSATTYNAEYRIIRPVDGEVRWVNAVAEIERDARGRAIRLIGAHRDVTGRRRAEDALRSSEQRLRDILDTMPQMVWSTQPDGRYDYFNRRWYEFTGVAEGTTGDEGWSEMFHPEDRARAWAVWRRSLETGEPYQIEYRLRHHSGAYRWVLGRALPVFDAEGRIERWFGTCTDIHDHTVTAEALRQTDERLQLALDAAGGIGLWVWDVPRDRVFADPRFAQFFGVDPATAQSEGAPIEAFMRAIHPEDRALVQARIDEAVAGGGEYDCEYRVPQDDGTVRWISARGRCEHDADGRPSRFPGAVLDVTARKTIEAELAARTHQLETLLESRELLARELSHRIKNIFSVIGSLIALSARGHPEAADFASSLRQRLNALALAHEYVRPHSPDAADGSVQTVHGLVRLLFAPYVPDTLDRVILDGEDVSLGPRSATALALCLHEQATNAVKYGALSTAEGRIAIATRIEEDAFHLVWRESGGPEIAAPPQRQGFGTVLAARSVAGQLGGELNHAWDPGGLVMRLRVPLSNLAR